MPKLDLTRALRIKAAGGELAALKGAGFTWPSLTLQVQALFATLGATNGAMYDATASASLWQDTAGTTPAALTDPIGRMNDLSGFGNHQLQATATARPIRAVGGASFDGIDDVMAATLTVSTQTQHYFARRFAVDAWTGNSTAHRCLTLSNGGAIFLQQAVRADGPTSGNRTIYTYAANSAAPYSPTPVTAAINAAGGAAWTLGTFFTGESFFSPATSVSVSVNNSALTTASFTGAAANDYTDLRLGNSATPGLLNRTERRSIWIAGPNAPDTTQRALIRAWLEEV